MQRVLILLAAAVLAACDRISEPLGPDGLAGGASLQVAAVSADPTPDQMAVARAVPGFGGYFIDASGAPTVYLTDAAQRPAAEAALAGFLASFGWSAPDLRVRPAQYDYAQLDTWDRGSWARALALPGAVFSDIDEGSNRLRFGGVDAAAVASIVNTLLSLGVPASAVDVQVTAPVLPTATLRDKIRPPHGGLQIQFFASPVSPLVSVCTLGFNAVRDGVQSFITNSHCTSVQGGVESTQYWQPLNGATTHVGTEIKDPVYFSGAPCPAGRVCRYSDAAMAQYDSASLASLGKISRTTSRGTTLGSITFATPDNFDIFNVWGYTGGFSGPFVGQFLDKVGRTTGWTGGQMTASCVNTNVSGTNITQLCQNFVSAGVGGGDSGSPVFDSNAWAGQWLAVNLYGILWGGNAGGTLFVFSPMPSVISELGPEIYAWCYC